MQLSHHLRWKSILVTGCILIPGLIIGGGSIARNKNHHPLQFHERIQNKTKAIKVVSAESTSRPGVKLRLKNISRDKKIKAFSIIVIYPKETTQIDKDFIYSDESINPQEEYDQNVRLDPNMPAVRPSDILISAVVFDDRTIDGDLESGKSILERREGEKHFLETILPSIDKSLSLSGNEMREAALQLKAKFGELPTGHHTGFPGSMGAGYANRQEAVLMDLMDMDKLKGEPGDEIRIFLTHLRKQYSKLISKFSGGQ